jgi:hypothetical protein
VCAVFDDYYCQTQNFMPISFFKDKTGNLHIFNGHQFTVKKSMVVEAACRLSALFLEDNETKCTTHSERAK